MGWSRLWALLLAGSVASCAAVRGKYPSWEPTPVTVPEVRDRTLALADLEVSRKLWLDRRWRDYSYVRARQTSSAAVEFTLLVVRGGTVTERSLFTSKVDASGLGDRLAGKRGRVPQLLWRERGSEVRAHGAGAPALTMDQLYDLCRDRVLSVPSEHLPRLSFHRDGLLQQCGFLSDDCRDCEVASMQTVGAATPQPWQAPGDLLCTDRYGVFLHDQQPVTSFGCESCRCVGTNLAAPRTEPEQDADQQQAGSGDICKIDPAACPAGGSEPARAAWSCKLVLTGDGCEGGGTRDVTPECLGLARPTAQSHPSWERRCRP